MLTVKVATVEEVAAGKDGKVVWSGKDAAAARQRRIAEEQANPKAVAWVE